MLYCNLQVFFLYWNCSRKTFCSPEKWLLEGPRGPQKNFLRSLSLAIFYGHYAVIRPLPGIDLRWTFPSVAPCNCRSSVLSYCRSQALEHWTWGHYICAVFTDDSTKTENALVSAILTRILSCNFIASLPLFANKVYELWSLLLRPSRMITYRPDVI